MKYISHLRIVIAFLSILLLTCCTEENSPPVCKITNPLNNDTIQIGTTLSIIAEADDEDGNILEVRFYIDETGVGSSSIFPYQYDWDTKDIGVGQHIIKAVAKDNVGSSGSDEKVIHIMGLPTDANAGPDQLFTDGKTTSTQLSANTPIPNHGQGKWTIISGEGGNLENDTVPNTIFTGEKCISYILKWTISNTFNFTEDNVKIEFLHIPANAEAEDITIIDNVNSIVLTGNEPDTDHGKGKWTVLSGEGGSFENDNVANTVFTGLPCTSYGLRWTISTECSSSHADISVQFNNTPSVAFAGDDQVFTDNRTSIVLDATAAQDGRGVGKWTVQSGEGGSFENDTDAKTVFTGLPCTTYLLRWTISTDCSSNHDDVSIEFNNMTTTANAGEDQKHSDGRTSTSLAANAPEIGYGTGRWTIVSGEGGSFENDTYANTIFTGLLFEEYSLQWTISTDCDYNSDEVKISFTDILTDFDGNSYETVIIGSQIWMSENLKTTHYADGSNISDYFWYDDNIGNKEEFGALYSYYSVVRDDNSGENVQGVCPAGWHVPNKSEWEELINYLGGSGLAGEEMIGEDSNSGFNGLFGGYRNTYPTIRYQLKGSRGFWWTSTGTSPDDFYQRGTGFYLMEGSPRVIISDGQLKSTGYSIRCVRD